MYVRKKSLFPSCRTCRLGSDHLCLDLELNLLLQYEVSSSSMLVASKVISSIILLCWYAVPFRAGFCHIYTHGDRAVHSHSVEASVLIAVDELYVFMYLAIFRECQR